MSHSVRSQSFRSRVVAGLGGILCLAALVGIPAAPASAGNVTSVTGSALGFWSHNISLFGGPQPDTGPKPTVSLASDASNSPQAATASTALVQYGPATLFTADGSSVSTSGSLGSSGSVTSSSSLDNINKATTQPATGSEIFTADNVSGMVSETAGGPPTGSATITNGTVAVHSNALENCTSLDTLCGGHTHDPSNPDGLVPVPPEPPANYKVAGHVHLNDTTTDYFVIVFNEQITNSDGSLTVNPVHEYFGAKLDANNNIVLDPPYSQGGSILHGDLYIGQVTAGTTYVPDADLSVHISDSPDPVTAGGSVTYHVTVTNAGPDPASAVTLTNTLDGSKLGSVTGASCSETKGKNRALVCSLGTLASGGSVQVNISAQAPKKPQTIALSSSASSTTHELNSADNSASEGTTVVR